MEDVGLVDVLPAPPVVDQAHCAIEHGLNLLLVLRPAPQQPDRPLHHLLGLLVAVEERVQLVHNVGFAVLLG